VKKEGSAHHRQRNVKWYKKSGSKKKKMREGGVFAASRDSEIAAAGKKWKRTLIKLGEENMIAKGAYLGMAWQQ